MASDPSYTLLDPRPVAAEAPYTFFLPSDPEIAAVGAGDLVKLMFEYTHEIEEWAVERMWVTVKNAAADSLIGLLENQPFEPKSTLKMGVIIPFQRHHILSIEWANPKAAAPPKEHREYWERCFVDDWSSTAQNLLNISIEKTQICRRKAINTQTADGVLKVEWETRLRSN